MIYHIIYAQINLKKKTEARASATNFCAYLFKKAVRAAESLGMQAINSSWPRNVSVDIP